MVKLQVPFLEMEKSSQGGSWKNWWSFIKDNINVYFQYDSEFTNNSSERKIDDGYKVKEKI